MIDENGRQHQEASVAGGGESRLDAWPGGRRGTEGGQDAAGGVAPQLCDHLTKRRRACCRWPGRTSRWRSGRLPGHGLADFHGDKIWLILGLSGSA